MNITPFILGRGMSGNVIAKSLACLSVLRPEFKISSPHWLDRNFTFTEFNDRNENPVLCLANPHGLHAQGVIAADCSSLAAVLCEKPACVNMQEIELLRKVKIPTAIFMVYRQTWGIQTLRQMIDSGQLGEVISIEGHYWQSSVADRVLQNKSATIKNWKNDPHLAGYYDTYLDVGIHWVDAVSFLYGAVPNKIRGWRSYVNAEASHRDTHIHLAASYPKGRAFGSISKTVHGAANYFELNVIGSKLSAKWELLNPDEILIGEGRHRRILTRTNSDMGSMQPAFHGMGWAEGYIDIMSHLFDDVFLNKNTSYPELELHLDILEKMLHIEWTL